MQAYPLTWGLQKREQLSITGKYEFKPTEELERDKNGAMSELITNI